LELETIKIMHFSSTFRQSWARNDQELSKMLWTERRSPCTWAGSEDQTKCRNRFQPDDQIKFRFCPETANCNENYKLLFQTLCIMFSVTVTTKKQL